MYEGSNDGITWHAYKFKYQICAPDSKPPHIAPYHPRFDMFHFYAALAFDWTMIPDGFQVRAWPAVLLVLYH